MIGQVALVSPEQGLYAFESFRALLLENGGRDGADDFVAFISPRKALPASEQNANSSCSSQSSNLAHVCSSMKHEPANTHFNGQFPA
ncbi:hypothetical protein QA645_38450 [Bradyrhizobium sp. CIAT3101]|uniref:hypothetical protein n=1 Tax=Bradyrhizobium sp. CIAT3101 TaxID=439387 RepID=UPI0024B0BBC4|nr:hypothetical protein [Bradyrhizobium sp. CIAT3101]WFU80319.1 hypothetical protein QA645_38450 [Bradyrhizobium sp. CIAT3101]